MCVYMVSIDLGDRESQDYYSGAANQVQGINDVAQGSLAVILVSRDMFA